MQLLVTQFTIKMFHTIRRGPTENYLQQLPKHQVKVTENECSHFVFITYVKLLIVKCITNSCIWNTFVTLQSIDYHLPEDDTIVSKHVGEWKFVKQLCICWSKYNIIKDERYMC